MNKNDQLAQDLRADFARHGIFVANLVSSPGAGKTELLRRTMADLRGKGQFAPTLDEDSFRKLVESGPWVRLLVAEHPNTPADVLDVLKDQPSIPLRLAVAGHPKAEPGILAVLRADIEEAVRVQAAMHPQPPKDVIELLTIAGASPNLCTADRPRQELSPEQARALASLGQWGQFLVARNSGCPPELLADIAITRTGGCGRVCWIIPTIRTHPKLY